MQRYFYSDAIGTFLDCSSDSIIGIMATRNNFDLVASQRDAWVEEIRILKPILEPYRLQGSIYFEYSIPRLGRRIDVVITIASIVFVLEFKVGDKEFTTSAIDQVWDYALDLKNFHDASHDRHVVPILIATKASSPKQLEISAPQNDRLYLPITCTTAMLGQKISEVIRSINGAESNLSDWGEGRYSPTPTIVEAATALYVGHSVADISRRDAAAINLSDTTSAISDIIRDARRDSCKSICFVTGVPGAGKTLVGLDIATKHWDKDDHLYSVFLSGNGPLVSVLREALARDKVIREAEKGNKIKKNKARSEVQVFIQNVHHFRDDCLSTPNAPIEHVALFDEAQRAWNLEQTSKFMRSKKGVADFHQSEPEYLISCMNRHHDWAVIVCLVGGGQEINTGEAGITEWIQSLIRVYPDWRIYISPRLTDSEYGSGAVIEQIKNRPNVTLKDELHLGVSMRSFRAERVSLLVKQLLDLEERQAAETLLQISDRYPIVMTRDLQKAKRWLRNQARGSERYGIIVSSQAQRLKPHAIDVRSPMDPIHWFLDGKNDVRSSYYLEDVATEFHVQGLELDWACVTWDADFRFAGDAWEHWSFVGDRWNRIRKQERRVYLKNAYRVLLTRARQGMVIVVPEGSADDPTRKSAFYDPTYEYLGRLGVKVL